MDFVYVNLFCVAFSSFIAGKMKDPLWICVNLAAAAVNFIVVASHLVPGVAQ